MLGLSRPPLTLDLTEPTTPHFEVIDVTPDLATYWLERNVNNRSVRKRPVAAYARDMLTGNWQVNGQTIGIDRDGNLIDGQHRLLAVVEAGVTVKMAVAFNLEPKAQSVTDIGISRTAGDIMGWAGYQNKNALAAAAQLFITWRDEDWSKAKQPTKAELLHIVQVEAPGLEAALRLSEQARKAVMVLPSVAAVAYYLFSLVDPIDTQRFFNDLAVGARLDELDPVFVMRRIFLNRMNGSDQKLKRDSKEHLYYFIAAWNYRRQGRTVKNLRYSPTQTKSLPAIDGLNG